MKGENKKMDYRIKFFAIYAAAQIAGVTGVIYFDRLYQDPVYDESSYEVKNVYKNVDTNHISNVKLAALERLQRWTK